MRLLNPRFHPPPCRLLLTAAFCILSSALSAAPSPLDLLTDSVVDEKALVTPVGTTFAGAMNGTAFQNDILVSQGYLILEVPVFQGGPREKVVAASRRNVTLLRDAATTVHCRRKSPLKPAISK